MRRRWTVVKIHAGLLSGPLHQVIGVVEADNPLTIFAVGKVEEISRYASIVWVR